MTTRLPLSIAIKQGRLAEFAAQEEARGIGPINHAELDSVTAALIKAPQSEDQTSHSSSDDDLSETKTRQGNGPYVRR